MKISNYSRRGFLASIAAVVSGLLVYRSASAKNLTPHASEGPFYPRKSMRFPGINNDLVHIDGAKQTAKGDIIRLKGIISDRQGRPLEGLRIEIWQCDVNGKYLHAADQQSVEYDPGFQGFGHDITDSNGAYHFRTIKPTAYPGRTPHIHVKVFKEHHELLTTQFYIKDHPTNTRDGLFNRMSASEKNAVSMVFDQHRDGAEAVVNITI